MPDYHLYDKWIDSCVKSGRNQKEFIYYTDYSIGFLTRGCFRKCEFCVNKIYNQCSAHSNLIEFMDTDRPKLCFLDDNFFACPKWSDIIESVKNTGKPFQFKQGLDERLLTEDKIREMHSWKYDGELIFAFDNIDDKDVVVEKLDMVRSLYPRWTKRMKFYCFCGFDRTGKYDNEFWEKDIKDLFDRIVILSKYGALPYIMRHENHKLSPYKDIYTSIASWCNQPAMFKTFTFHEFCVCRGMVGDGYKKYKRDVSGYMKEYGDRKYKCWKSLDEFNVKTNNRFMKYENFLPKDLLHK